LTNLAGYVGRAFLSFLQDLSGLARLFLETMKQAWVTVSDRKRLAQAGILASVNEIGTYSLTIVLVLSLLIGVALTVIVSFQTRELGLYSYVPGVVAVAVFRLMGPLLTAIIVAGRIGAGITARLGTMKVSEEVLALETMAINPVRFLVVRRLLAMLLALPALTVLACFTAVFGGFLFGTARDGIRADVYLRGTLDVLDVTDIVSGVVKALVYAVVIVMISSYRGLVVEGSAEEVGRSTMITVVWCTLAVIVMETLLTVAFYG
jgi:phospholipid/cholesterol/gamma-HCH transport system permease protein